MLFWVWFYASHGMSHLWITCSFTTSLRLCWCSLSHSPKLSDIFLVCPPSFRFGGLCNFGYCPQISVVALKYPCRTNWIQDVWLAYKSSGIYSGCRVHISASALVYMPSPVWEKRSYGWKGPRLLSQHNASLGLLWIHRRGGREGSAKRKADVMPEYSGSGCETSASLPSPVIRRWW